MTKVFLLVTVGTNVKLLSHFITLVSVCHIQTYEYSNLTFEQQSIKVGDSLNFTIDIENTGAMDGQEIVQIYVRDVESSVERPLKELKDFQKYS